MKNWHCTILTYFTWVRPVISCAFNFLRNIYLTTKLTKISNNTVPMNNERGFPFCNHSFCSHCLLKDVLQLCFQRKRGGAVIEKLIWSYYVTSTCSEWRFTTFTFLFNIKFLFVFLVSVFRTCLALWLRQSQEVLQEVHKGHKHQCRGTRTMARCD